jgi:hypothetical protein
MKLFELPRFIFWQYTELSFLAFPKRKLPNPHKLVQTRQSLFMIYSGYL